MRTAASARQYGSKITPPIPDGTCRVITPGGTRGCETVGLQYHGVPSEKERSLLAKILFTATNGSSHILEDMYKQKHNKQKHILPSSNLSEGHANSVAFTARDIQQVPAAA